MTKKVQLFSGKVLKITGGDLSPNRYKWLKLAEAEPDLGTAPVDGSLLVGNTDNTRQWSSDVFISYPVDPDTALPITTLNINGDLQVSGKINGVLEVEIMPATINLPDGASIKIGNDTVLDQTTLGTSVVNSSLTSVGTITTGTWQADPVEVPYGGTGRSFVTANTLLAGDPTNINVLREVAGNQGDLLQIEPNSGRPTFGAVDCGGY